MLNPSVSSAVPAPARVNKSARALRTLRRVMLYAVLIFVTVTTILPVLWMIVTSFKTRAEYARNPWFLPREPTLTPFIDLFQKANFGRYFFNSVIVTLPSVFLILLLAAMAAFALVRYDFRGRNNVLTYFLLGQMVPVTTLLAPLYLILRSFGMINTYQGLIFSYTAGALPLAVFLIRGFFLSIPSEVVDAARIDGATELGLFRHIFLPLGAPGLATAGIFEFLSVWNDIILVLIVMQRNILQTLNVAVFQAVGEFGADIPSLFAGLTVAAVPVVIAYLLFTRQFIQGLTAGATKG